MSDETSSHFRVFKHFMLFCTTTTGILYLSRTQRGLAWRFPSGPADDDELLDSSWTAAEGFAVMGSCLQLAVQYAAYPFCYITNNCEKFTRLSELSWTPFLEFNSGRWNQLVIINVYDGLSVVHFSSHPNAI